MKALLRGQFAAVGGSIKNVAMAFTKGVVDLGHDGAQAAVRAVAVPKAHRLEGVAQHARVSVQPDVAVCVINAFVCQHLQQPGQRSAPLGTPSVAMVGVKKTDRGASVYRQAAHGAGLL